jgi:hypothetical protein
VFVAINLIVGDRPSVAPEALCRTLAEAERRYGRGSAFEWVGLLCRHGAASAMVSLLEARDGSWTMTVDNCVPRTLLRIYWPLARS